MAKGKGKHYVPAICGLAQTGVHDSELQKVKDDLAQRGAKDITVTPDEGDYSDFEPGPYWRVDYRK